MPDNALADKSQPIMHTPVQRTTTKDNDMEEYNGIMDAVKILTTAQSAVSVDDGTAISPAWLMLRHAVSHLQEHARIALRGE